VWPIRNSASFLAYGIFGAAILKIPELKAIKPIGN